MMVIRDGPAAGRNDAGSEPDLVSMLGHMIMILTTYVLLDLLYCKFNRYIINLYIKLGSSFINLYIRKG